jgi:hypothetical protein
MVCDCERFLLLIAGFIGLFNTARDYTVTHTYTHQCPQSHIHYRFLVAAPNRGHTPSSVFPNSARPLLPAFVINSSQ